MTSKNQIVVNNSFDSDTNEIENENSQDLKSNGNFDSEDEEEQIVLKKSQYLSLMDRLSKLESLNKITENEPQPQPLRFDQLSYEEKSIMERFIFESTINNAFKKTSSLKSILIQLNSKIENIDLTGFNDAFRTNLFRYLDNCKTEGNFKNNHISNKLNLFRSAIIKKCLINLWLVKSDKSQTSGTSFKNKINNKDERLNLMDLNFVCKAMTSCKDFEQVKLLQPNCNLSEVIIFFRFYLFSVVTKQFHNRPILLLKSNIFIIKHSASLLSMIYFSPV
jgi:hypothetical protein